jgi:hypothetical protein
MQSPLELPGVREKLVKAVRKAVTQGKQRGWDEYVYWMMEQDGWDEVLQELGPETYAAFDAWFEQKGAYPTPDVADIFSREEMKVFGKSVPSDV